MIALRIIGVVVALLASGHVATWGQTPPKAPEPYFTKEHPPGSVWAPAGGVTAGTLSPEVQKKWEARQIAQYDYEMRLMEYNVRIFEWQRTASNVLLGLVSLLVLAGVMFAGFQLWHGTSTQASAGSSSTDLELSMQKVKVTSSVVGVVILVLSLAFVYLFLHEVYTMKPAVDTVGSAPSSTSGTATSGKTQLSTSGKLTE
jgi:hypothetical protein